MHAHSKVIWFYKDSITLGIIVQRPFWISLTIVPVSHYPGAKRVEGQVEGLVQSFQAAICIKCAKDEPQF